MLYFYQTYTSTKGIAFRCLTSSGGYWKKPTAKTGCFDLKIKGETKQ